MDDGRAPAVVAAVVEPPVAAPAPARRLWNANFFLLWQGQLVSAIGDAVYGIALGFWVLERTGSTALMGTLMATSMLPRVVVSPFAGVLVDRADRKGLLVLTDGLRGVAIVAVAVAAFAGALEVWMVFAAGILLGLAGAFFNPAVSSAIPDIVPTDRLVKANSAFSMLGTGSGIVGNAAGGLLFQALGAPLMFLVNGLSYLFSAGTELFIRIPPVRHERHEFRFVRDLGDGLRFVWRYRGIRFSIMVFALLNFFAVMGFMLFLPLFQQVAGLGAGRYGILTGTFTAGLFLGFLLMSVVHVPYRRRFAVFYLCGIVSMLAAAAIPGWLVFPAMLGFALVGGATNAVLNSFLNATLQAAVPQALRGKVFSLIGTVAGGLMPLAFALGGGLAEFIPIRPLIAGAFLVTLLCFLPLAFSKPTVGLVNYDPEHSTLEDIR